MKMTRKRRRMVVRRTKKNTNAHRSNSEAGEALGILWEWVVVGDADTDEVAVPLVAKPQHQHKHQGLRQ
jgi:hypothetical protein